MERRPDDAPVDLLRFITCGNVDDGKSTLIGRLLYDSKLLFDDQLEALHRATLSGEFNLANLTDGLRAEREQGITIDVAYRYFTTLRRRFIVADTPGHVQYTRNMITGASTANLALILVDARHGITQQTRRHSHLASLVGIPHLCICVNKMDLVDFAEPVFNAIRTEFEAFSTRLEIRDITFIPLSALHGDNVVRLSERMPYFHGPPLFDFLENVHIANDRNLTEARFPVQWVIRPRDDRYHDFRGYAGQIASGVFRVGHRVVVLPSGQRSRIRELRLLDRQFEVAYAPMSITMLLEDDLDISRGDVIVNEHKMAHVGQDVEGMVCWMAETPLAAGRRLLLKHCSALTPALVRRLDYRVNVDTLEREQGVPALHLNEIGRARFETARPLVYDPYRLDRATGAFILIDEVTNATVGAGMLRDPSDAPLPTPVHDYAI